MRLRLLLLAAGLPASAAAQAPGPTLPDASRPDTLGRVTVTAARVALSAHRAPARVSVLTRADAEASGSRTVADLVEARSGVFVRRYGPDGLATLALRGGAAGHTLVTLDGHAVTDPQLGQVDVSLLPVALVETAEVLHGAASALYGTDAVGGVVALRTPGGAAARAVVRAGAWGERGASVFVSARVPGTSWSAALAADAAETRGDYVVLDPTLFDPATGTDGVLAPRANADRRTRALFGRVGGDVRGVRIAAGALATDADRGLFELGGAGAARQDDAALRAWLDAAGRVGGVRLSGGLARQQTRLRYQDPAIGVDSEGVTRSLSAQLRAERAWPALGGALTASAGARLGRAAAEHPNLTADARETSAALFASAVLDAGRVLVAPAVRLDRSALAGGAAVGALSPSLGASGQPTPWPGLRLKASAGRAFRAPTFNDRFWQPGGDPGLRPERGYTLDAGASLDARPAPGLSLSAEATVFRSALRDAIVWRPGRFPDGFYWAPLNVGRTRTRGHELSADVRARRGSAHVELGAVATRAAARDVSDPAASSFGQALLYTPDRQTRLHATLGWGGFQIGGGVRTASTRATATDGSARLPGYAVWDARAEAALALGAARARLALHLDNLTDARYEVTPRQPMPPRHARVSLTLESR